MLIVFDESNLADLGILERTGCMNNQLAVAHQATLDEFRELASGDRHSDPFFPESGGRGS